jgi:hypothetical protein
MFTRTVEVTAKSGKARELANTINDKVRGEHLYQQLDSLQPLRLQACGELLCPASVGNGESVRPLR